MQASRLRSQRKLPDFIFRDLLTINYQLSIILQLIQLYSLNSIFIFIKSSPSGRYQIRIVRNDGEHRKQQADGNLILRRWRRGQTRQITEDDEPRGKRQKQKMRPSRSIPKREKADQNGYFASQNIFYTERRLLRLVPKNKRADNQPKTEHYFYNSRPHKFINK